MAKAHRLVLQESMVAQWPQMDHLGQECHLDHQDLEWRPWVDHQGQTWVLLDLIWVHQGHVQEWPLVLPGLAWHRWEGLQHQIWDHLQLDLQDQIWAHLQPDLLVQIWVLQDLNQLVHQGLTWDNQVQVVLQGLECHQWGVHQGLIWVAQESRQGQEWLHHRGLECLKVQE